MCCWLLTKNSFICFLWLLFELDLEVLVLPFLLLHHWFLVECQLPLQQGLHGSWLALSSSVFPDSSQGIQGPVVTEINLFTEKIPWWKFCTIHTFYMNCFYTTESLPYRLSQFGFNYQSHMLYKLTISMFEGFSNPWSTTARNCGNSSIANNIGAVTIPYTRTTHISG